MNEDTKKLILNIVQRIEKLTEEAQVIAEDIKEVYKEAKDGGLDPKYIKEIIRLRKLDKDEIIEHDETLELYKQAVGI